MIPTDREPQLLPLLQLPPPPFFPDAWCVLLLLLMCLLRCLCQGSYPVRLVGQDVQRGTFNHRHMVLHDQVTTVTRSSSRKQTGCLIPAAAHLCS